VKEARSVGGGFREGASVGLGFGVWCDEADCARGGVASFALSHRYYLEDLDSGDSKVGVYIFGIRVKGGYREIRAVSRVCVNRGRVL
jgi:hypothetical protein